MRRFNEETVRAALRASWRRAASPTMTPAPVNPTIDGSRARPSASGMTLGIPPSTYATRLLVVPRSMPTMRDMRVLVLPERLAQVIDDGPEICPRREGVREPREQRHAVGALVDGGVPLGAARHDCRFRRHAALEETPAIEAQPLPRGLVEAGVLGLFECLLDLHHLHQ